MEHDESFGEIREEVEDAGNYRFCFRTVIIATTFSLFAHIVVIIAIKATGDGDGIISFNLMLISLAQAK